MTAFGCGKVHDKAFEVKSPGRIIRTRMNTTAPAPAAGNTWLLFTLLTVLSWGVYGILLHKGQTAMSDPVNGRYKAFLFVGIAYFLTAVLAPLFLLMSRGAAFSGYTTGGAWWSLIAGIAGAIGAFGVLLAFGAKGTPAVVMSLVFAGAPLINAVIASLLHPPAKGWGSVNPLFFAGIILAVAGGYMVARYNPANMAPPKKPAVEQAAAVKPATPKV
jgi:drug/metabolite transporter (DMT)-like permease